LTLFRGHNPSIAFVEGCFPPFFPTLFLGGLASPLSPRSPSPPIRTYLPPSDYRGLIFSLSYWALLTTSPFVLVISDPSSRVWAFFPVMVFFFGFCKGSASQPQSSWFCACSSKFVTNGRRVCLSQYVILAFSLPGLAILRFCPENHPSSLRILDPSLIFLLFPT